MKRKFYIFVMLGLLLGMFAAPAGAQEQKVVRILGANMDRLVSLDNQYWTVQTRFTEGPILEGLFGYGQDGITIVPKVAESWSVSDDGKEWTIELRKDKKWSNGESVTANDFYETWVDFMLDTQAPMWASWMQFANGYNARGARNPEMLGLEVVDTYTLKITTDIPKPALYAFFPVCVSLPNYPPAFESNPNEWWTAENWVGNGPYIPVEFDPGQFLALEPNPEYVGEPGVDFGNVDRFEFISGTGAGIPAYEAGEIDVLFLGTGTPSDISYIEGNAELSDQLLVFDSFDWTGYQTNRSHGTVLDNKLLRQALYMAIDREYLAEDLMQGLWEPAHSYGWAAEPRIYDKVEGLPYDPDRARELLVEAGYPDGEGLPEFVFYTLPADSGEMPFFETLAQMWKEELNIDVKIQPVDWGQIFTHMWAASNPLFEEGFLPFNGAIDWFDPQFFTNQAEGTLHGAGYTGEIRQARTEANETLNKVDTVEEVTQEAWDEAVAEAESYIALNLPDQIEDAGWENYAMLLKAGTPPDEQLANLQAQWDETESEDEKLEIYKSLLRWNVGAKLDAAVQQYELSEEGRDYGKMQDLFAYLKMADFTDETFDKGAELLQMFLEEANIVPLGIPKFYALAKPGITGVVPRYLTMQWLGQMQYINVE